MICVCVNSVSVYPSCVALKTGEWYHDVYAVACPADADCRDVRWYSSNTSVATVNATTGFIYARSAGTTRVYAEATDGSGCKDYITVTVTSGTIRASPLLCMQLYALSMPVIRPFAGAVAIQMLLL